MGRFIRTISVVLIAFGLIVGSLTGATGATAQDEDKPTVTIGSKDFTESILLAEMAAALLEDNGYTVERQLNLGGTAVVHQALVNGEIDMYVEYTGTGLLAILGRDLPETDATPEAGAAPEEGATPAVSEEAAYTGCLGAVYDIVAEEYPEQFQVEWLQPWGFNNTYALAVTQETAEEYGLETVSDLEGVAGELTFGATQEFLVRPDGLPGLEEHYGIDFGDERGLDPGLLYEAVDQGQVDVISAFATDGRIPALDLVVLEDDQNFFPPYCAAPVVRQDLLEESPEVRDILNQLAGQIDDETMADLNFQIDEGGTEPSEVAQNFLEEQGLIGGDS
ncbi:MAG TPA: glycine betaine ABC transporter substrate-binding protein [Thermomicrobiales bacterium]|nr:glycine betaine ABC transporter substrate-binding protein [Thermomicrobiales bacterium]